jgi:hypothetical protein
MSIRSLAVLALSSLAIACGSSPSEETAQNDEAVRIIGGFAPSYWQIDTANPSAGEVTLLNVTATTFWGERCADDACVTPTAISGTYKRSRSRLYLYDANHAPLATFAYSLAGSRLALRDVTSYDRYSLDPMSESLCDSSGGAWSDDDLATHGFNCTCPNGGDWGPSGCN